MGMKYIPYRVAINPPNAMTHLGFKTYALGINTNLKKRYNIYTSRVQTLYPCLRVCG